MMKLALILVLVAVFAVFTSAQTTKPGACPPAVSRSTVSDCRSDANCRGNLKCCRTLGNANLCTRPVSVANVATPSPPSPNKPGFCPTPFTRPAFSNCRADASCSADLKCCPTLGSAVVCTKPVASPAGGVPATNRAATCPAPDKHPGVWACSSTCRGDSDCYEGSRCCENRCGARVCTEM